MKSVLIVASEPAPGMIPFAVSMYEIIEKSDKIKPYLIMQNRNYTDYRKYLDSSSTVFHVDFPNSYVLRCINKIFPYKLVHAINSIMKNEDIKDLHLITGDFSLWLYILLFWGRNGKKLYYTVHDLVPHEESKKQKLLKKIFNDYLYFAERKIRSISFNLMTCSASQYKCLVDMYQRKKISFIHFPSLVSYNIKNGKEKVSELENEQNYILFFGRAEYYKGIDLLVDAYLRLNLNCKLVIAGSGNAMYMEDERIIRINRFINDEEICDLFSKAALVVFPYRNATMSGVFSIPMYYRKKIVASNIPFFEQYKDSDIHYFDTGDVASLTNAIKVCLSETKEVNSDYTNYYSESLIRSEMESFYM